MTAVPTASADRHVDDLHARATRRAAARLRLVARWIDRPTGPLATHLGLHLRVLAIDAGQEVARITHLLVLGTCALLLALALDALLVTIAVLAFEQRATQLAILGGAIALHAVALAAVMLRLRLLRAAAAEAIASTRAEFAADLALLRSLR